MSSMVRDRIAAKSDLAPFLILVSIYGPILLFAIFLITNLSALILKPVWRLLHCLILLGIWGLLLYQYHGASPIAGIPLFADEKALRSLAMNAGQLPIALGFGLVYWHWRLDKQAHPPDLPE